MIFTTKDFDIKEWWELSYYGWEIISDYWTLATSCKPIYEVTISSGDKYLHDYIPGTKIKINQGKDSNYFIITQRDGRRLTLFGGNDYELKDIKIEKIHRGTKRIPKGFPADPDKWMVTIPIKIKSDKKNYIKARKWYNIRENNLNNETR